MEALDEVEQEIVSEKFETFSESCESIPEEYNDNPTINNSPSRSASKSGKNYDTNMSFNRIQRADSKRSSRKLRMDSSSGTKDDANERVKTLNTEKTNDDSVKRLLK